MLNSKKYMIERDVMANEKQNRNRKNFRKK